MNSKEALSKLSMACDEELLYEQSGIIFPSELTRIIEQDLDRLEKLEKENQELKNTILSLEVDTFIPELRKENAGNLLKEILKLKKAIEIFTEFGIILKDYCNGHYSMEILYDTGGLTKEQYELLKEVLSNER